MARATIGRQHAQQTLARVGQQLRAIRRAQPNRWVAISRRDIAAGEAGQSLAKVIDLARALDLHVCVTICADPCADAPLKEPSDV